MIIDQSIRGYTIRDELTEIHHHMFNFKNGMINTIEGINDKNGS